MFGPVWGWPPVFNTRWLPNSALDSPLPPWTSAFPGCVPPMLPNPSAAPVCGGCMSVSVFTTTVMLCPCAGVHVWGSKRALVHSAHARLLLKLKLKLPECIAHAWGNLLQPGNLLATCQHSHRSPHTSLRVWLHRSDLLRSCSDPFPKPHHGEPC
eukprot:353600-Chlamydomonas_euryale.AAC.12